MKKKSFAEGVEAFFTGKGFYIVLILCIAVIGCSAWIMFQSEMETEIEPVTDLTLSAPVDSAEAAVTDDSTDSVETAGMNEAEHEPASVVEESGTNAEAAVTEPVPSATAGLYVWPCAGTVETAFSVDALVYNRTMADWRTHEGVDVTAELGEPVRVVADGTVERVYQDDLYGMTVIVSHGGGLTSTYSNLAEVPTVSEGDTLAAGDVIGAVGTTAICEAGEVHHLHLEMALDGTAVDPCAYLPAR